MRGTFLSSSVYWTLTIIMVCTECMISQLHEPLTSNCLQQCGQHWMWLFYCIWGGSRGGSGGSFESPELKWKSLNTSSFWWETLQTLQYVILWKKTAMKREKINIDAGESFPCFRCPVDPTFEELKSDILVHTANIVNTNLYPLFQIYSWYWSRFVEIF